MDNLPLTMISHFNGIALLPLAAAQAGIITVATTEIDPYCNAISRQWFPHATQYTDIRTARIVETADIICGGDPCQPHSNAGKRAGKKDPRYLWEPMFRSIEECRPTWVINENVSGSLSNLVLDGKASDLEGIGYTTQAFAIEAGAVGAPHRRERIILVAHALRSGREQQHLPPLATYCAQRVSGDAAQLPALVGPACRNATKSEILRMANGSAEGLDAASRRARIKALGNGVDPQVFVPFFRCIAAVELGKEVLADG